MLDNADNPRSEELPSTKRPRLHDCQTMVSVIIPVFNTALYLDEAFASVATQTHRPLEVSIYDDGSTDGSTEIIADWLDRFKAADVMCVCSSRTTAPSTEKDEKTGSGPGAARNRAVSQASGHYLCFLDSDDYMMPDRVASQLDLAIANPGALVGSGFVRIPEGSTDRYTRWCNSLTAPQLLHHRFRDCTVIQPTWFIDRNSFDRADGYLNCVAEDMRTFHPVAFCDKKTIYFLYTHIERHTGMGPAIVKVDRPLVTYRYRGADSFTSRVSRQKLCQIRAQALERQVLNTARWRSGFGIWGGGKNGRAFYRSLSESAKAHVTAFYDIDPAKIGFYNDHGPYCKTPGGSKKIIRKIPVLHLDELTPPFITCVSLDRTDGEFEKRLAATGFVEGTDWYPFS